MKKVFNLCWLGLKQPKNGEKCHCYGTFKPSFSILTCLGNFQIKGGESGDIGFFTSKYERKHAKAHWIGLHSTKNALVIHLIFRVLLQKSKKKSNFEKKSDHKSWDFGSGAVIQIVSAGILS